MSDFEGMGFAIGSVRGVRSFAVNRAGLLTGVTYDSAWAPGENVSTCRAYEFEQPAIERLVKAYGWMGEERARKHVAELLKMVKGGHTLDVCSCGFYAFYDGSNDYGSTERISAVVEGYGETIIGTRGFRSRKARIVALCFPRPTVKLGMFARWFSRHPGAILPTLISTALGGITALVTGLVLGIIFLINPVGSFGWWLAPAVAWGAVVISQFGVAAINAEKAGIPVPSRTVARIRRNYPDVAVFESFSEMVAAYPPDRGEQAPEVSERDRRDAA